MIKNKISQKKMEKQEYPIENVKPIGDFASPYPEFDRKNSFKITRNTKGYNWEIRISEEDLTELKTKVLDMNNWAKKEFEKEEKEDENS